MKERTLISFDSKADKDSYERHVYNVRIEKSVIETAEFKAGLKAARKTSIEVALTFLKAGSDKNLIATATKLTLEELDKLERGEELELDIDKDTDDDE